MWENYSRKHRNFYFVQNILRKIMQFYPQKKANLIQGLSLLWLFQAIVTFITLLASKSDRVVWANYSIARLMELFLMGIIIIALIAFIKIAFKPEGLLLIPLVQKKGWKEALFFGSIFFTIFPQISLVILLALSQNSSSYYFAGYANHLRPIFNFITLVSVEFFLWVLFIHRENFKKNILEEKKSLKVLFIVLGTLIALTLFAFILHQNYKNNILGYLGGPTVPLLEWQILLAWFLGMLVIFYGATGKLSFLHQRDIWVALIIWVVTSVLWISQPVNPGFAATEPIAPNFEIYPFSDAQLYAQNAQSIIIGKGMAEEQFPARPLYVIFLAIIHALAGQRYEDVIIAQVLVLATFPAVLYLLGKEISGRALGIAMAILAILRDITINQVAPFTVSATYSKLFVSELPVALLLSLFALISIKWLKNHSETKTLPFIAGGIIGLTTLVRTQSIIVVAPLFLILLTIPQYKWKKKLLHFSLFLLGVTVSLSPWLMRNWQLTGGIVIDNPLSQMNVFAVRYSEYDGMIIPHLPEEDNSQYTSRMLNIAIESVRKNPEKIIPSIVTHFFQNELGNLLVFPLRNNLPSLQDLWKPTNNFWENWNTEKTIGKYWLIPIYLTLLGIGITVAWRKLKWLGLFPLAINLSYNLWTALFLASGIRFIFPTDWVFYMYGMLGLLSISSSIFVILGIFNPKINNTNTPIQKKSFHPSAWTAVIPILFIILAGLSLPASEHIIPDQFPKKTQEEMWLSFFDNASLLESTSISARTMQNLIKSENLSIYEGKVLYPRYYGVNEGIELTDKPGYKPVNHARLVFHLIGQRAGRIIFPMTESPYFFPHAADVTIILKDDSLGKTWLILINQPEKKALYLSPEMEEALK